ncbi:hypothetical protein [Actinomycetospora sp. NBC_00405]|jgi:hypothetical protein|uniref:hypothetical protein n=1 Tax=Actinomycetospora sp. NBC_00405 TaxID=2975952 RepID=UPI002E249BA8
MSQENERAAQRAHRNVGLPDEEYDDTGRPAAARARDADPSPSTGPGEPERRDEPEDG